MRAASGLRAAASAPAKSAVPRSPITSRPGMNFRVAGFGVDSVSMNMASVSRGFPDRCGLLRARRNRPGPAQVTRSSASSSMAPGTIVRGIVTRPA